MHAADAHCKGPNQWRVSKEGEPVARIGSHELGRQLAPSHHLRCLRPAPSPGAHFGTGSAVWTSLRGKQQRGRGSRGAVVDGRHCPHLTSLYLTVDVPCSHRPFTLRRPSGVITGDNVGLAWPSRALYKRNRELTRELAFHGNTPMQQRPKMPNCPAEKWSLS